MNLIFIWEKFSRLFLYSLTYFYKPFLFSLSHFSNTPTQFVIPTSPSNLTTQNSSNFTATSAFSIPSWIRGVFFSLLGVTLLATPRISCAVFPYTIILCLINLFLPLLQSYHQPLLKADKPWNRSPPGVQGMGYSLL